MSNIFPLCSNFNLANLTKAAQQNPGHRVRVNGEISGQKFCVVGRIINIQSTIRYYARGDSWYEEKTITVQEDGPVHKYITYDPLERQVLTEERVNAPQHTIKDSTIHSIEKFIDSSKVKAVQHDPILIVPTGEDPDSQKAFHDKLVKYLGEGAKIHVQEGSKEKKNFRGWLINHLYPATGINREPKGTPMASLTLKENFYFDKSDAVALTLVKKVCVTPIPFEPVKDIREIYRIPAPDLNLRKVQPIQEWGLREIELSPTRSVMIQPSENDLRSLMKQQATVEFGIYDEVGMEEFTGQVIAVNEGCAIISRMPGDGKGENSIFCCPISKIGTCYIVDPTTQEKGLREIELSPTPSAMIQPSEEDLESFRNALLQSGENAFANCP